MARKRKRRSQQILDRVFDGRAQSLEASILFLVPLPPPPPAECLCGGAGCLRCGRRRHLVRKGDPFEYKNILLKKTYCLLPPNVPLPIRAFHRVGWDQRQIVRHVMEEMLNSNVLCMGYEENSRFSSNGEALCTHAWVLLLERIGDHLMVFLLRFSSIFLPLTNKSYQQVTGSLLSEMLEGHATKRQRINYHGKLEMSSYTGAIPPCGTNELGKPSTCSTRSKSRKHTRLFSWQRRGKHKKMTSHSCLCQTWEISDRDAAECQINRRQIFYNTLSSYSTFPTWHILNRLKPNNSGAALLMENIFGLSSEDFQSCINRRKLCTSNSNCLYHNLLYLLKSLVKNAQHCDRKKLLHKHCPNSTFEQYRKDESISEVGKEKSFSLLLRETTHIHLEQSSGTRLAESSKFSVNLEREKCLQKTPMASESNVELVDCYCTHQQVVSFIWAIIRNIIPPNLLGDCSSWRSLRSNISQFVRLQRYGKFTLSQCLHGLETSNHPSFSQVRRSNSPCFKFWAGIGNCNCAKNGSNKFSKLVENLHIRLFRRWVHWLFSCVVVPIISSCFYVTERQFEKLQVFYYPKTLWRNLADNAVIHLEKKNYRLLDYTSCTYAISDRNFGFSKVRFLPKRNEVRIVANTKAPCKVQIHGQSRIRSFFVKSVNSSLKELHAILRSVKHENPQALGSSVFGYDDVHKKLFHFLQQLKFRSSMIPKVYIVVGDVAKAFDTIKQDKLVSIMKDIIRKDEYILRICTQVVSAKKRTKFVQDHIAYDYNNCSNDAIKFEATTRYRSSSCVIVDQGEKRRVKKDELHRLLIEHLKHNILKIGQKFYLQTIGICQGSSISSLLCSFYLGHLERSIIFPYLEEVSKQSNWGCMNKELELDRFMLTSNGCNNEIMHTKSSYPDDLLLRWTDDFLFISTSKQQAASFFRRMERGFREYNCEMNIKKFGVNFEVGQNKHMCNRLYIGMDGVQFLSWSGLLINCNTLEIQADYTRYLSIPLSSTITVESNCCGLSSLKAKLCDHMRPKCHPLFYDSNINSSRTVRLNAYQAFLICAMKFHCYVRCIADNAELHPNFLLEIIERSFRFMYMLIKKQMGKMAVYFGIHPVLDLKREEINWLGLCAYIWVLKKKQSRYKELLSLLRCKISTHGRIDCASDSLKYAIDDLHSSVFQQMHF